MPAPAAMKAKSAKYGVYLALSDKYFSALFL